MSPDTRFPEDGTAEMVRLQLEAYRVADVDLRLRRVPGGAAFPAGGGAPDPVRPRLQVRVHRRDHALLEHRAENAAVGRLAWPELRDQVRVGRLGVFAEHQRQVALDAALARGAAEQLRRIDEDQLRGGGVALPVAPRIIERDAEIGGPAGIGRMIGIATLIPQQT